MRGKSELKGKTALITGAGKGIGSGIALEMARRGANVVVNYRSSDKGARQVARKIRLMGRKALIVQADVSDKSQVARMADEARRAFGAVDILVNNAALQKEKLFHEYDDALYHRIIRINLKGYLYTIQEFMEEMKRKGWGRIINVSSIHGKRPTDFDSVYAMSKGGIKMLTREAALELGPYGITVNALEPGGIDVGLKSDHDGKTIFGKYTREQIDFFRSLPRPEKKQRLNTHGQIDDVAYAAGVLASPRASLINGSGLRMDGGAMLI